MQNLQKILQDKFKLEDFREWQLEIIESIIAKNDTLVFMPTWWGKSLTYQFPWVMLPGLVIIISPLISLMKDQVDKLNEIWIRTEFINSSISVTDKRFILDEISQNMPDEPGCIKFLYIAPERLHDEHFLRVIKNVDISLIAIDEAHCISQWWHDFRPSYMKIKWFIDDLRTPIPTFPLQGKRSSNVVLNYKESPEYITELMRDFRKNLTSHEDILWQILRRKSLDGLKFRRQHPFWRYIADFYSDELKLVIELDWKIHDTQKEYDKIRDDIISSYWVTILRIKNETIEKDLFSVIQKILSFPSPCRGGIKGGVLFPIVALTATATKKVREDIVLRLGLKNYKMYTKWFDRKNLVFIVREIPKKEDKLNKVVEIIRKTPPYWIIYCSSIKAVKEVYEHLKKEWINAWIYTGEMKSSYRETEQNNFMDSTYDVIVATNAFGMWIDKRDIRYVIHYNLPWSIENYYQEAGRAWRDGKVSYSIVIASYQDTIIQEFFIENAYPWKEDILKLYDYIFKEFTINWWKDHQILMTYDQLAKESKLKSGMQVWSIVKIFEKYWIVRRWFDVNEDTEDFRWRWITITLGKKEHKDIPILWDHQNILKNEAYFKLEQIKKLLFKPGCRKRFILEYFGDEEDIRNLWDNCGVCDYCLDKKKLTNWNFKEVVKQAVFFIVLEFIKRFDNRFGVNILASILVWAKDKKITEWDLDLDRDYAILEEYQKEIIIWVFEVLINTWFLYKSEWQYPKIWLTEKWRHAIFDTNILLEEKDDLQSSLFMKVSKYLDKPERAERKSKRAKIEKAPKESKVDTYTQTLELFNSWISIDEIAKQRDLTKQTIESHIVSLYSYWKIPLNEVMKLSELKKLKFIKEFLAKSKLQSSKLWEIKYTINQEDKDINYVDIKLAQAMIEKKDL